MNNQFLSRRRECLPPIPRGFLKGLPLPVFFDRSSYPASLVRTF
jgi:hypothetical protein